MSTQSFEVNKTILLLKLPNIIHKKKKKMKLSIAVIWKEPLFKD